MLRGSTDAFFLLLKHHDTPKRRPEVNNDLNEAAFKFPGVPPMACYFQRNSWKFEGRLIEVIIDLWLEASSLL